MDTTGIDAVLQEASDTRHLLIDAGALAAVNTVFVQAFGDLPGVVIADEHTFAVAGQKVYEQLRAAGHAVEEPIIFPGRPTLYADFAHVLELEQRLRPLDATPVVVGSGTLNDITKLASHRVGRPYMCVGTAASMDGYTAFGAAITKDGFKQTMACPAPRAVLADLDIIARAPTSMSAAGYGDLLGKVTAGVDWILADALEIEPIDKRAWPLVQDSLRAWTGKPELVRAGEQQAIAYLFEGLIMCGVAMQISGSSRPASGSEHRFSHLWEMEALAHGHAPVPHGFKVGIGSIATAALYERLMEHDLSQIDIDACCRRWPTREEVARSVRAMHDVPQLAENAVEESLAKYVTSEQLRARLLLLQERWPQLREQLGAQLMSADELRSLLGEAGCPTDPAEVGVSMAHLKSSYALARTIRARYTVLDLVYETGVLDDCVAELFAPGGFWARSGAA